MGRCFPDLKLKVKILDEKEITSLVADPECPKRLAFGNSKGDTALPLNVPRSFRIRLQ